MHRFILLSALAACNICIFGQSNQTLLQKYCVGCHNDRLKTGGVSVQGIDLNSVNGKSDVLEKVLRKVRSGEMPPAGLPRPDAATAATFSKWLEGSLDADAIAHPNPGRPAIHRLNRAEYSNAIRDLLALDINVVSMLPVDDSGYGFDNIGAVLSVSPVLLDRYLTVARKVARQAIGDPKMKPVEDTFEARRLGQSRNERVSDDLPFNSEGGLAVRYNFPVDAEYVFRVRLGNPGSPSEGKPYEVRVPVKAGLHSVGVTFPGESLKTEIVTAPNTRRGVPAIAGAFAPGAPVNLDVRLDGARVKRTSVAAGLGGGPPQIASLSIAGPYDATGRGETAARERIFVCRPESASKETACAQKILGQLARRAYRRPVQDADVRPLVALYQNARAKGDFDYGVQKAMEALLVAPDFIFRVESDPKPAKHATVYRISDIDLASRLSFFLWSSIPDDELLDLAAANQLHTPAVLERQVRRMLDDPRSHALVTNFAGQWLYVRNLATIRPDPVAFPTFDESLRAGFQSETELFFESVLRENRSVIELLDAPYTFLNERVAKHYGIPDVFGSQFRRVTLANSERGGLLGQGSLLTVTSYPNRTSVVQRGKWVLENLLGAPPPPPPANVPPLEATTGNKHLTLREAMEQHRANAICAGCHARMDPIGFALENYDGVGKYRTKDGNATIDASGKLPDGTKFDGPAGLRQIMANQRRDEFVATVIEKLLTYALGRGVESTDLPTVRAIARQSAASDYRLADLVDIIVKSPPFQMRSSAEPE